MSYAFNTRIRRFLVENFLQKLLYFWEKAHGMCQWVVYLSTTTINQCLVLFDEYYYFPTATKAKGLLIDVVQLLLFNQVLIVVDTFRFTKQEGSDTERDTYDVIRTRVTTAVGSFFGSPFILTTSRYSRAVAKRGIQGPSMLCKYNAFLTFFHYLKGRLDYLDV
jgi:hypothetical protein